LAVLAALSLVSALPREDFRRSAVLVVLLGVWSYAIVSPFLSPSMLQTIRKASMIREGGLSLAGLLAVAAGWLVLQHYLHRGTKDWTLRFFALLAYFVTVVVVASAWLHVLILPQPGRYKFEMDLVLPLILVFALRRRFLAMPPAVKATAGILLLVFASLQIRAQRRFARNLARPEYVTRSIEYRATTWAEQNLAVGRIMLPGTLAQWAGAFTALPEINGSSWSQAFNPVQQMGVAAIYNGGETPEQDARTSIAWLKAFGAGAVVVSGPMSEEFWKPFKHPNKFAGILPALWQQDDVTIYRVPQRTTSLAHVLPLGARVVSAPRSPLDVAALETYNAALDDSSLPAVDLAWEGNNTIRIRTTAARDQIISLQVSYHPGWRATANGLPLEVQRDGLGLIFLDPQCNGPCELQLTYGWDWEMRICRAASYIAIVGLLAFLALAALRRLV